MTYFVFLGRQHHAPLTRARTISVFRQCVTALFMVKDQHPQAVKEAVASVLPVWLEAFKVLLNIHTQSDIATSMNWDGLSIHIQIFKVLSNPCIETYLTISSFLLLLIDSRHNPYFVPSRHDSFPQRPAHIISNSLSHPIPIICSILPFILSFCPSLVRGRVH
jgi:hypothetical protein